MILVTGASGFVGRALCKTLAEQSTLRISVRDRSKIEKFENVEIYEASLSPSQNWSEALEGVSTVIHCAARVHVMKESAANPLAQFRLVNVEGTMSLARQAAAFRVRRFIYISSVGVNGSETFLHPFSAEDAPWPCTPYAISKHEAEVGLQELAKETNMEVVIIRPPLVYGPNAPGNFFSVMRWLSTGVPIPMGGIVANRRSFVYIDNLVDLILKCAYLPAAANQIFLVSDGEDASTAVFLKKIVIALGPPARLIVVPATLIVLVAKLVGRADIAQRLCGCLQVDIKKTKDLLGWSPPVSVDEGLRRTAAQFLKAQS
jgi:nucleoside-diphosphate-sugar epimerase